MKIIALSGGIAAGKNHVAEIFAEFGARIFDADKINHDLLKSAEIVAEIATIFPDAIENKQINRKKLGEIVFKDKEKLVRLEKILHPRIRKKYQEFLQNSKEEGVEFVVLNIPLLLEKQGYDYDYLVAIISNFNERKKRYIKREMKKNQNLSQEFLEKKFEEIASHQILDEERIKKADFVLRNEEESQLKEEINTICRNFSKMT